jgi:Putative transposase
MEWSQAVCRRLPDCPHFHVVFTIPEEVHEFFKANYALAATLLFQAAAATLKKFQQNNWGIKGGFVAVLHTWGQMLNWHPHLHVLVSAGGMDLKTGRWKEAGRKYLFAVKAMSKVFRGEMLRRIEELDADREVRWPASLESVEQRRDWRLRLSGKTWNIFSRPTLGNTRAVVRYLARYTSRIAISNQRLTGVDEEKRTVSFNWKDYRDQSRTKEMTLGIGEFLRRFAMHLVPKGLRRVRYYGLLTGPCGQAYEIPGGPGRSINEDPPTRKPHVCGHCQGVEWLYVACFKSACEASLLDHLFDLSTVDARCCPPKANRFSLGSPRDGPQGGK